MTYQDYQEKLLPILPKQPGVYRFIDKEGTILYVGKAKVLRNRVANYFTGGKNLAAKTRTLVKNADRVEFTIVDTETDALLLENTLIKKFQPRYNVNLRDDKSYSYIVVKNERFPRVFFTRFVRKDGSTYFGPYASKSRLRTILDLIKQLFPLRTCKYNLSEENIEAGKFKVCLEYHIKNCQGPCVSEESEEEYNEKIAQIKNMLKGDFSLVKRHFTQKMQEYAEHLQFEKAQALKSKLSAFEDYQHKSTVVNQNIRDVDVFSIAVGETESYINYLKVVNGALMNTYTTEVEQNLDSEVDDILSYVIPEIREKFNSIAPEVICAHDVVLPDPTVVITHPQRGDKKKLLELSEKNVQYYRLQKKKEAINNIKRQTSAERILKTMQQDLQMDTMPFHIECFDNSNIQGSHPVSSCVVFKNAKPSKKDYRHYNIKTVEGPNDFASMQEVVRRRYTRLLKEDEPLPDLIIIDGGKGQLSASYEILQDLGIEDDITIIGIAKRLEEIFFPNDPVPLYINKKSESLKVIQHARNEAHRFAITFHRNQRSRNFTKSELTSIPGVGDKTAQKLLVHFGSVKKVKTAMITEMEEVVGKSAARKVADYFRAQRQETRQDSSAENEVQI